MAAKFFKYVVLKDVGDWLKAGWTVRDDLAGTHHGAYAVLMLWTGDGEPVIPKPSVNKDLTSAA